MSNKILAFFTLLFFIYIFPMDREPLSLESINSSSDMDAMSQYDIKESKSSDSDEVILEVNLKNTQEKNKKLIKLKRKLKKYKYNQTKTALITFFINGAVVFGNFFNNIKYNKGLTRAVGFMDSTTLWMTLLGISTTINMLRYACNCRDFCNVCGPSKFVKWANAISSGFYGACFFLGGPIVSGFRVNWMNMAYLGVNSFCSYINWDSKKNMDITEKNKKRVTAIIKKLTSKRI